MTQEEALKKLKGNGNILLTGEPGSGKSYLTNKYINWLEVNGKLPAKTASTGIAALQLNGKTLHSWCGVRNDQDISEDDMREIVNNYYVKKRIFETDVLIIDEVSMVSPKLLDIASVIASHVRKSPKPFGGIKVVLVGDFFQLPPVHRGIRPQYAFESPLWEQLNLTTCYLTEQHRTNDTLFVDILRGIRNGTLVEEQKQILRDKIIEDAEGIEAIRLYTHNDTVDKLNQARLFSHEGSPRTYTMESTGNDKLVKTMQKSCMSPEQLILKVGVPVMFTKNDNEMRWVNGTRGTVVQLNDDSVNVEVQGEVYEVKRTEWKFTNGYGKNAVTHASISQLPLRVAWAITVHKCIHPDTLVETENGLERIGLTTHIKEIATLNGPKQCGATVHNPVLPGYKITTDKGYTIETTADHGMLLNGNRVEARHLKVGDALSLMRGGCVETKSVYKLPKPTRGNLREKSYAYPTHVNEMFAEFLGLVVADGTVFKRGVRLVKRHTDVVERFGLLGQAIFGANAKRFAIYNANGIEFCSTEIARWLGDIGGLSPNNKYIPDCILRSSVATQRKFLRGLFEDGTVNVRGTSFSHIEWSTSLEQMSQDVQVMLLRCGIVSTRKRYQNSKGFWQWRINIYGVDAALFRDEIGFVSSFKQERLRTAGNISKVHNKYAEKIVEQTIESIEPVNIPSACVTVPDGGQFIQGGFCGFNSQGMTLDSAIIDCSRAFACGHGYVAVSRVRSLDGLHFQGKLTRGTFAVDKRVQEFDNAIRVCM